MNNHNCLTIFSTFLLLLSVAWNSHAHSNLNFPTTVIIAPTCANIAQVSVTENAAGNAVTTFQLAENKNWTAVHFSRMSSRIVPPMQQQGLLLTCTFDVHTQTITATFDGDSFAANPTEELNKFFTHFGYKGGYTLI